MPLPDAPMLEAQSSFAEDAHADPDIKKYASMAVAKRSSQGPAHFDPDDIMRDEEEEAEKAPFQDMFECHVKNLVEFTDKRQMPQRNTRDDM